MRLGVLAGTLMSALIVGQTRPDFSGHWVPVSPPEIAGDSRQTVTIRQTATTLAMIHPSERGSHSITYNLDGSDRRTTPESHAGIEIMGSATWKGERLVFREAWSGPKAGASADILYVIWLDAQGRLVFDLTEPGPDGRPRRLTAIFRKADPSV